jgi:hypothetical protein
LSKAFNGYVEKTVRVRSTCLVEYSCKLHSIQDVCWGTPLHGGWCRAGPRCIISGGYPEPCGFALVLPCMLALLAKVYCYVLY